MEKTRKDRHDAAWPLSDVAVIVWGVGVIVGSSIFLLAAALDIHVPDTVWGVLIGSGFTVLGVYLNNRATNERLTRQFVQDNSLKAAERLLSLRRDTYFNALEAITVGMQAAAQIMDLNVPEEASMKAWLDKAPLIARTTVVSDMQTFAAIQDLVAEINAVTFEARMRRIEVVREEKQAADAGQPVPLFGLRMKFIAECLGGITRMRSSLVKALAGVRQELGIDTDLVALEKIFESVDRRMLEMLHAAMTKALKPSY